MKSTQDIHVRSLTRLSTPNDVKAELPMTETANETVIAGRDAIQGILDGTDHRLLAIMGPCSIHDEKAAIEYAGRLKDLAARVADRILVVMRVYFEKPRTTVGWKGLINDPHMDDTFDIETGIRRARKLLLTLTEMGVATGTEMLEPITPQYIADLVSWASIGARTTESPTHRQMASGLSMPVGFKNATDGNVQIAVDAMLAAFHEHSFLGIDGEGCTSIVNTTGNKYCHLILRGGRSGTNYDYDSIAAAAKKLSDANLNPGVVVDCSHANSEKDHNRQEHVWNYVVDQYANGNRSVLGAMLESNIHEGNQKLTGDLSALKYGVSITDACISWEQTEKMLLNAYDRLENARLAPAK